jgi:hypothetical protein
MHNLKIGHLLKILEKTDLVFEGSFKFDINPAYLKGKGEDLLSETFSLLGGTGSLPVLEKVKFDFKINRFVFLYDDAVHFNRYRLHSLKSSLYENFTFSWVDGYKRLCRSFEKECLKAGLQQRIWEGPPLAQKAFGHCEQPGDLSGNGSSGWKLNAYNDVQYDLLSRLHGYKLIRIPMYENLMIGGGLKKIDDLLLRPSDEIHQGVINWINRKMV